MPIRVAPHKYHLQNRVRTEENTHTKEIIQRRRRREIKVSGAKGEKNYFEEEAFVIQHETDLVITVGQTGERERIIDIVHV